MNKAELKKLILDILLPQHLKCHSCGREAIVNDHGVCSECESKVLFVPETAGIQGVDGFASGMQYNDVARRAMIPFKYNGAVYKKEFLTHYIRIPESWSFDCFVPVPLHPKRQRKRGYNQSEIIANALAERYPHPVRTELLERLRDTPKQARMTKKERLKNVKHAFRASDAVSGLSIVLVDDVRTTGATLFECAAELKRRGAARVYAVTACCSMMEVNNGN